MVREGGHGVHAVVLPRVRVHAASLQGQHRASRGVTRGRRPRASAGQEPRSFLAPAAVNYRAGWPAQTARATTLQPHPSTAPTHIPAPRRVVDPGAHPAHTRARGARAGTRPSPAAPADTSAAVRCCRSTSFGHRMHGHSGRSSFLRHRVAAAAHPCLGFLPHRPRCPGGVQAAAVVLARADGRFFGR